MGLTAEIYKSQGRNFSNHGLSEKVDQVTIVNIDGPSVPDEARPAVLLVPGASPGIARVVPAVESDDGWFPLRNPNGVGPMMGGCYVGTADSRFVEAVEELVGAKFYGAVPLHDRYETTEEYAQFSG